MIIHENRLLADDSHEISYLIFLEIRKEVNSFLASSDFCHLLITSANSMDPDQELQNS